MIRRRLRRGEYGRARRIEWWGGSIRQERLVEQTAVVSEASGGCGGGEEEEKVKMEVGHGGYRHS